MHIAMPMNLVLLLLGSVTLSSYEGFKSSICWWTVAILARASLTPDRFRVRSGFVLSWQCIMAPKKCRTGNQSFDVQACSNCLEPLLKLKECGFLWNGLDYPAFDVRDVVDQYRLAKHASALIVFLTFCPTGYAGQVLMQTLLPLWIRNIRFLKIIIQSGTTLA